MASSSYHRQQIRQIERRLAQQTKKRDSEESKAVKIEGEMNRLINQAKGTRSASMQGSYLRRADGKQRDLQRAREAAVKASTEASKTGTALSTAQQKLREAEAAEQRRDEQKAERDRKAKERRAKLDSQRQVRAEQAAERDRQRRDAERDREVRGLQHRTTELEQQLAEAERRVAPEEITVLFLAASPEDQDPLRLDKETREIQKRVRSSEYRESIFFEWRMARQLPDLIEDLNIVQPDIIHFSGHGNAGALVFEDGKGNTAPLSNEQLGRLLGIGGKRIRLALFNSCNSADQAQLASNHVDVAIGMESTIGDETAKTFAGQLYNSLGFGVSVAEAFRQAVLQVELVHGEDEDVPTLFAADGVDAETVVLVNPGSD
jgi:hypothetical protein